MAIHSIEPAPGMVHGRFSRDLPPVLTIDSGDTVVFRTLDAGWGEVEQNDPFSRPEKFPYRDAVRDTGHALCGPVAVRGARPGMTLEVRLDEIRTGRWGWCSAGGYASPLNQRLGLAERDEYVLRWVIDPDTQVATSQAGHSLVTRPFMGILGMPPDEPGEHSTTPPRPWGGNIDCRELVAGSRVYLPIPVEGGLLSVGDGHACQGDGEVAGTALECPMERLSVTILLRPEEIGLPRAWTPRGWLTFGFDTDLDEAAAAALEGMLDLMQERHGLGRQEALAIASLTVDLRVSQLVNGVRGVHAFLRHGAFRSTGRAPA